MTVTAHASAEWDGGRRKAAMAILFVVAVFNYLDRNMLSILQIPMKADLHLSDTQLGLLTGGAFALFYAITAIPISRVADRAVRKTVLAGSLALWGAATALTAGAGGFASLAAARMAVGVGEAGCIPTSHAILSDYYPPRRRASALAFWSISAPVGTMLGLALAGWLNGVLGWRAAFLLAGGLSIAFVPIVYFLLKEPPRGRFDTGASTEPVPLLQAVSLLWTSKLLRYLILGVSFHAYFLYSQVSWAAPFYSRVHHMALGELALWLALLSGLCGGLGTWLGGIVADGWGRSNPRAYMLLPAFAALLMVPAALAQFWAPGAGLSLVLAIAPALLVNLYLAPTIATAQTNVPPGMRAFISAAIVLIANLVGMGLGPVVTGALSDLFTDRLSMGPEALRYAITTAIAAELLAAGFYLRAAGFLPRPQPNSTTENKGA